MVIRRLFAVALALTLVHGTAAAQEPGIVQIEAQIAQGIEDRQPVNPGTSFPVDVGRVFAWTRVTGAGNTTIEHVWRHLEHEFVIPLEIGGSPWRTWTSKNIPPEWDGEWTFLVRDAEGTVVFETTFSVGDGS